MVSYQHLLKVNPANNNAKVMIERMHKQHPDGKWNFRCRLPNNRVDHYRTMVILTEQQTQFA